MQGAALTPASPTPGPRLPSSTNIFSRLLLLGTAVALPVAALVGVGIYERFEVDRAHFLAEMKVAAEVVARTPMKRNIDLQRAVMTRNASLLAQRWGQPGEVEAHMKSIQTPELSAFTNVLVLDNHGEVVGQARTEKVDATQPAYRIAAAADAFQVNRVFRDTVTGHWTFLFSQPISDGAGRRLGTVISPIDLEVLGNAFHLFAPVSRHGFQSGLLDEAGTVLLHHGGAPKILGSTIAGFADFAPSLRRGESVMFESIAFGGQQITATFKLIAGTPWTAFIWVPSETISQEAQHNLRRNLLATGLALALGVVAVWYFARQIARPIKALADAARSQAEGHADSFAPVQGPSEVAATAQAFNDMVSAKRRTESLLAQNEQRYRTIIEQTGQMVYELELATDTVQWFGADATPVITGYNIAEMRQISIAQWREMIHPEDKPAVVECFVRSQATGNPYRVEYRLCHRDGSWRTVENTGVFLCNDAGRPERLLGRITDITERKQAESSFRAMAQLQDAVLDNIPILVIAADLEGTVTMVNRAGERMHGYTAAEMVGKMSPAVVHVPAEIVARAAPYSAELGEPITPGFDVFVAHARRNLPNNYEWTCIRKDGSHFPAQLTVTALRDHAGTITGYAGVVIDLTERHRSEEARQKIEKKMLETQKLESLGILAGGSAHDFTNLLTGVLGHASLARLELPPGAPALQNIDQIEVASRRAAELCRQMLAYSGKGHFIVQRLDLNRIVEDSTHLLQISVSKQCVLRTNLARPLPTINADATQIRQIIMNLVINASEAIGTRSGVIALTTGVVRADRAYLQTLRFTPDIPEGDYAFIEISDNGCGMDEATLSQIFDPFFTTKFTGRGLGLAAVLGIMRGHRGGLKVYSEPSRGTTFKMLFPCVSGPADTLDQQSSTRVAWRGRGTVLVIDDEETVRAVSARMLENLGFGVVLAEHGRDGFEKFQLEPDRFSLVLLDLTMPHMDGQETFRHLRVLRPAVKILLMSGFNQQEAISHFTGKGLAGFVQKPFEIGTLAVEIRRVLEAPNGTG